MTERLFCFFHFILHSLFSGLSSMFHFFNCLLTGTLALLPMIFVTLYFTLKLKLLLCLIALISHLQVTLFSPKIWTRNGQNLCNPSEIPVSISVERLCHIFGILVSHFTPLIDAHIL